MNNHLRILFVAQGNLKRELGGPKVVIELAEAINNLGYKATVVGPEEIEKYLKSISLPIHKIYSENINSYLNKVANRYNVVDVDANHLFAVSLPPNRSCLIVARSVLFIPHLAYLKWPQRKSLFSYFKIQVKKLFGKESNTTPNLIHKFYTSLNKADIINVSNHMDVELLLQRGFPRNKILDIPFGLHEGRRQKLTQSASVQKTKDKIVFLGTFDFRKGCLDIPKIYKRIKTSNPSAELTMLGTKGLFSDTKKIFRLFSEELHSSIQIIPEFKTEDLPGLLRDCKIGIFPSYLEGFGFSVIEKMAAGIPVIAYDAPGPSSILRSKYLVKPGDWQGMAKKVIYYLNNESEWNKARIEMLQDSQVFNWKQIAQETVNKYKEFHYLEPWQPIGKAKKRIDKIL